jgi:hypothetical protein
VNETNDSPIFPNVIRYETSDGQKRDETGTLKDAPPTEDNPNNKVIDVIGSYEFTSPEGKFELGNSIATVSDFITFPTGKTYRVEYTSGVNGFLPKVSIIN